jgi:hypothetical protein
MAEEITFPETTKHVVCVKDNGQCVRFKVEPNQQFTTNWKVVDIFATQVEAEQKYPSLIEVKSQPKLEQKYPTLPSNLLNILTLNK